MSVDPRALVEQAIARTRANSVQQLAVGVLGALAVIVFLGGSRTFITVLIAVNGLITFFILRRWVRLRPASPAVVALLERPEDVAEIASWPRKVPPNRMPVMLDITTRSGHTCSLLLDAKQPQAVLDLLGALQRRSPEAILKIPKLTVA